MKKYLSLVKLLFIQQYRVKPTEGKKKRGGTIAAFVILGLCFLPMLAGIAMATYYMGELSQGDPKIASFIIFVSQGLVLLFGVQTLISNVFTTKDADKLLFLPTRSTTIFAAKLTVAYLNEVITTVVLIVFALLPFGAGARASVGFYILLVPAIFMIPMLPMLLGSIVAIPLSALIAKIGRNSVLKTILQILLFVIIMAIYLLISYNIGMIGGGVDGEDMTKAEMAQIILNKFQDVGDKMVYIHSNYTLASAMLGTGFGACLLSFVISVAENALLLGFVLVMSLPFYHWILSSSVEGAGASRRKKSTNIELQVKNQGVVKELIFTDLKRVTRDSQMGFQSLMGLIMLPIMVVVLYICFNIDSGEDGAALVSVLSGQPLYQPIASMAIMAYMTLMGVGTNVLGCYPISRENKSIYIIKSLPISFNKFLLAKVIFATAVMTISNFLTCLMVVILFGVKWYYGLTMLATMLLLGFGGMCITTLIDLKSPKLGWTNFNQSLKNAKNSWMAMLIGLCASFVLAVAAVGFILWYAANSSWYVMLLMWSVVIAFSAVFAFVCYKIMTNNAQKYFEKIEP